MNNGEDARPRAREPSPDIMEVSHGIEPWLLDYEASVLPLNDETLGGRGCTLPYYMHYPTTGHSAMIWEGGSYFPTCAFRPTACIRQSPEGLGAQTIFGTTLENRTLLIQYVTMVQSTRLQEWHVVGA